MSAGTAAAPPSTVPPPSTTSERRRVEAGRSERVLDAPPSVRCRGRMAGRGRHVGEGTVPEQEEMLGGQPPAQAMVGGDARQPARAGGIGVEEHDRHRHTGQPLRVPAGRARRRDDEPVHAALEEEVEVGELALRVIGRVPEHDAIAAGVRLVLDGADDEREERIGDVRHQQAERPGLATLQRAGDGGRGVVELADRGEDALAGRGPRDGGAGHDARHGRGRHPGTARDVDDRRRHRAQTSARRTVRRST